MITELWVDDLQIMDLTLEFSYDWDTSSNFYVNKFQGLELPSVRDNRPTRSRRHGSHELTTLYDPREFEFSVWVQGMRYSYDYDLGAGPVTVDVDPWDDLWYWVQLLKQKMGLGTREFSLSWLRMGNPYGMLEKADVVISSELEPRFPHPATPICVFDVVGIAADPRLYGADEQTSGPQGSGTFDVVNSGNFPTPPTFTFSGMTSCTLTNNSLSTENILAIDGASGTTVVESKDRTVSPDPDVINMAYTSFWSLKKGTNSITFVGDGTVEITWNDARI